MSGSTTILTSSRSTSEGDVHYFRLKCTSFDDWAHIFVHHVPQGVEVVIRTDYGTYDYAWWNIGPRNPFEFLGSIGVDYAMGKFRPLISKRAKDYPQFVFFRDNIWPRCQELFKRESLTIPQTTD
jgi:hypothetical protein